MSKRLLIVVIVVSILLIYVGGLSISQESSSILTESPHYSTEVIIEPNSEPELEGTLKCTVKLKNLETGEDISGPNLFLVKGMDGTAGTSHDWANLDTFIKVSSDKEGKTIYYSLDIYYKGNKIGNSTCNMTLK